jgi:hypothetical protein
MCLELNEDPMNIRFVLNHVDPCEAAEVVNEANIVVIATQMNGWQGPKHWYEQVLVARKFYYMNPKMEVVSTWPSYKHCTHWCCYSRERLKDYYGGECA